MLPPVIKRQTLLPRGLRIPQRERGVTMALVAVSMVAIISMAALSIDLGTLYEAKAEAQRAADLAALAAARVISVEGVTGDPNGATDGNWAPICGSATSAASSSATNVAYQNLIAGAAASTVYVYYGTNGAMGTDQNCTDAGAAFAVNPIVQVYVQQKTLPTFFAHIFSLLPTGTSSNSGVSATATAEAFNSSGQASYAVQPRCVKPLMVPNYDPVHIPGGFVTFAADGEITKPGVYTTGVIGENFWLVPFCTQAGGAPACVLNGTSTPKANTGYAPGNTGGSFNLQYLPGEPPLSSVAVPTSGTACSNATSPFAQAIAGCDQTTQYQCGQSTNVVDFATEDPTNPDATNGGQCLIHQTTNTGSDTLGPALLSGQDTLAPFPILPAAYPFEIEAGTQNPLIGIGTPPVSSGSVITSSTSIASLPIFNPVPMTNPTTVTIVGFLQVFINFVDANGNMNVTVMNVSGCGSSPGAVLNGTSPVPIRLITPQ
jgi:Putative Flp pilus-assembly TadE/G-like